MRWPARWMRRVIVGVTLIYVFLILRQFVSWPPYSRVNALYQESLPPHSKPGDASIQSGDRAVAASHDEPVVQKKENSTEKSVCKVVDYHSLPPVDFKCYHLKTVPSPEICVYADLNSDTYVSRSLARGVPWEQSVFNDFVRFLKDDTMAGFLDIGANLGQYSLYAAMLGRPVVAVEAYEPTLNILQHSIVRNKLTNSIVLVHNAVAESRRTVVMKTYPENKGGSYVSGKNLTQNKDGTVVIEVDTIYMDDLVEVLTFDRAIMKMDIETYEAKAMSNAEKLLDKVFVAYILMEWAMHDRSKEDLEMYIPNMMRLLTARSYVPEDIGGRTLDKANWRKWPNNVVWKHSAASSS